MGDITECLERAVDDGLLWRRTLNLVGIAKKDSLS